MNKLVRYKDFRGSRTIDSATQELDSFNDLFDKYWQPLLDYAACYLPDKAEREEVIQELFIELYLKRERLSIHISLAAYLRRSVRNRILNFLRQQSIYRKHVTNSARDDGFSRNETEDYMDLKDCQYKIQGLLKHM